MEPSPIQKLFGREPIRGNTIFHVLAKLGSLELLNRICDNVDEPCDSILHEKNYNGEFCTHVVAKNHRGQAAIVLMEALMNLGADLNAVDARAGFTVLHETVLREDYELAEWLCQQPRLNLDSKTWGGLTAYQLAFKKKNQQMMDLFRTQGANCEQPNVCDSE